MEPLSALALAGNILQFVQYATGIISKTCDIYKSAEGSSASAVQLEDTYHTLSNLCLHLQENDPSKGNTVSPTRIERELQSLSTSCQADCEQLLDVFRGLRVGNGKGRAWKSFRAALKYVWKSERRIDELSARLQGRQQLINAHVCTITMNQTRKQHDDLERLTKQNQRHENAHMQQVSQMLDFLRDIKNIVTTLKDPANSSNVSLTDIEDISAKLSKLSVIERNVAKEQAILTSLDFNHRRDRYAGVSEAHVDTFHWIFDDSQCEHPSGQNFLTWLQASSGVFWVTGKPGSGKSTLMKYLAKHSRVLHAAASWAFPDTVIIAAHYLWKAGSDMQKSYQGLLRSLLYDVFRQSPKIIGQTCGPVWETHPSQICVHDWSLTELQEMLHRVSLSATIRKKVILFVDGLDEHDDEHDHMDVCLFLKNLAKSSSNIKICAASRPWPAFEQSFGNDPKRRLDIHNLTRGDVEKYARSRLEEHPGWGQMILNSQQVQTFVTLVTERAEGVFLWVRLVVQSLREGITNNDSLHDLTRRLQSLPTDLASLYQVILDSVEPIYHQKMAEILLLANVSYPALTIFHVYWLEKSYEDPEYAFKVQPGDLPKRDYERVRQRIARRLACWCKCLLEVLSSENGVTFIHRTAADFVRSPATMKWLEVLCRPEFCRYSSMCCAETACLLSGEYVSPDPTARHVTDLDRFLRGHGAFRYVLRNAKEMKDEDYALRLVVYLKQRLTPPHHSLSSTTSQPLATLFECCTRKFYVPIQLSTFHEAIMLNELWAYPLRALSETDVFSYDLYLPMLHWPLSHLLFKTFYKCPKSEGGQLMLLIRELLNRGFDLNELPQDTSQQGLTHSTLPRIQRDYTPWETSNLYCSASKSSPRNGVQSLRNLHSPWIHFLYLLQVSQFEGPIRSIEFLLHNHLDLALWTHSSHNFYYFIPGLHIRNPIACTRSMSEYMRNASISLFLRHGADPNAYLSPFIMAWTSIVTFAFTITEPDPTLYDAFLTVMDDLFNGGARLGATIVGLTVDPRTESAVLPFREITGWDIFCQNLEYMHKRRQLPDGRLIAAVTAKMIRHATKIQWPLGRLPEIVRKVFPEEVAKELLDSVHRGPFEVKGKRQFDEPDGADQGAKRLKMIEEE